MSSSWMTSSTANHRNYPKLCGATPNNRVEVGRALIGAPLTRVPGVMITVLVSASLGSPGTKKDFGTSHRNEDKTINFVRSRNDRRVRNDCRRPKPHPQRDTATRATSKPR